ncbi:MAG: agglutinin biogenesis protein MshP [Burkholderiales bacterium]
MNARRPMAAPAAASGERGFGLFAAIAILVILAVLGAAIVSVTGLRSSSTAIDVLGSRALLAARAGIEWNMYRIQNPETNPTVVPPFICPVTATNLSFGGVLSDFTVTVSPCTTTTATEAGNTVRVYQIVATACNFPAGGACPNNASTNPSYVERKITVLTETCRLLPGAGVGPSC